MTSLTFSICRGIVLRLPVAICLAAMVSGCSKSAEPTAVTPDQASATDGESAGQSSDAALSELLELSDPASGAESGPQAVQFHDVAAAAGASFQRFNDAVPDRHFLPEVMGGGVAWIDVDGDKLLDLYLTNGCSLWNFDPDQSEHVNRLFRNLGNGQFTDVTPVAGADDNRYGQGCAVGDLNADGFADLYVTNFGRNTLLLSNGDGTFQDVTASASVGDESWGTSAVWLDANRDDLSDLYVANYVHLDQASHKTCTYGGVVGYCGPGQWDGVADILYLNQGDGTFKQAPAAEQVQSKLAKGLAVAACDFNDDQSAEIYVANDMAPNFLLTAVTGSAEGSETAPVYRNVAESAGCAVSGDGRNEASMGVACADFDRDGMVDIFLTHYYQHKNTLYRNLGGLLFEDNSQRSRIAASSFQTLGFGTAALDADHDGDEDLFIANGHVLGPRHQPNAMTPQFLSNDGQGFFTDVSAGVGEYFQTACIGRGAAAADYDNDGRVDLGVSHLDLPLAVLHNETVSNHNFIGFELLSQNRVYPAGAKLILTSGQQQRTVPVVAGGSYLSAPDPRILVGLADQQTPVTVEVVWPDGQSDVFSDLSVNQYWQLRQRSSSGPAVSLPAWPAAGS